MYPLDLEKEESIDLGKLWQVTKAHKKVVGGIVVGCTAAALVAGLVWPKTYESTTTVQTRMTGSQLAAGSGAMAAAAALGIGGTSSPTLTYVELMKSNTVLQPILVTKQWPATAKPDHRKHKADEPHQGNGQGQDPRRSPENLAGCRKQLPRYDDRHEQGDAEPSRPVPE